MTPSTVAAIVALAVIGGVIICLAMIIKFLGKIYERGGPADVRTVARALRDVYDPSWPTKLLGYLPPADERTDDDPPDAA
jgi:hypothetical protein